MKLNNKQGFSLIELLVALSILAVVAAIIVPRFLNVRQQASQTTSQAQQRTLQRAVQQFLALGGTIGTGTSGDVLTLLSGSVSGAGSQRTASGQVADSGGQFGSSTISLNVIATGTTQPSVSAPVGYYYSAGNPAYYADGAGSAYTITVAAATGNVTFTPLAGSANATTIQ